MPHDHDHRHAGPVWWCLAAAALFGASTPAAKWLLSGFAPFSLAGVLYLGAALAVLPFVGRGGSRELALKRANLVRVAGAVAFGGIAGPVLLLFGLRLAPAGSVSLWLNLESIATAVLGWMFFREQLDRPAVVAALLVFAGSVLLSSPQNFSLAPAGAFLVLACCCWGLDNNLTALIDGLTPAQTTAVKGVIAGLVNIGIGQVVGEPWPAPLLLLGGLAVGALGYGVSLLLYVMGAQALGAIRSQMLFATAPFLGLAVAWGVAGEEILAIQLGAGLIMAAGLAVMLRARHGHRHRHAAHSHTHLHSHDDGHHDHQHPDLPAGTRHAHPHDHDEREHTHPHHPDLHHRHEH